MKKVLNFEGFIKESINETTEWGNDYEDLKKRTGLNDTDITNAVKNLYAGKTRKQLQKNDIKVMQAAIDTEEKYTKPDGGYGAGTITAVKNWQTKGLGFTGKDADGIWGPNTAKATFDGTKELSLKWLADKVGATKAS